MKKYDYINSIIGNTVYVSGVNDLAFEGEFKKIIREKTPLTVKRLTKAGKVLLKDEITKKEYSVPASNVSEFNDEINSIDDIFADLFDTEKYIITYEHNS